MSSQGTPVPAARSKADPTLKPGFTYEEMWSAIDALVEADKRRPGEFTVSEAAEHWQMTRGATVTRLSREVAKGTLEKRFIHTHLSYYRLKKCE